MWIDVNKEVPKQYDTVLAYNEPTDTYYVCFLSMLGDWKQRQGGKTITGITHWYFIEEFPVKDLNKNS